ncbi:MAG TPA: hypothetical protein VGP88_06615 [Thermoplasmata archaeon]|nr:hypothetical protein [Thermoplasmata archaeon]
MTRGKGTRWLGAAAMGTLGIAVLMVMIVPASAASAPAIVHTVMITAPYTGAYSNPSMSVSTSGCGTAAVITAPFWHARTGDGGFSGRASGSSCAPIYSGSGYTTLGFTSYVPIVAMPGHDKIVVKWALDVTGAESIHSGACRVTSTTNYSECYESASSSLSGYAYLVDLTNGSYLGSSTTYWNGTGASSYALQYCYSGNCSTYAYGGTGGTFALHGNVAWTFHVHGMLATHQYELVQSFTGYVSASSSVYGSATLQHGHASAWLNAGTFGNGIRLASITIT